MNPIGEAKPQMGSTSNNSESFPERMNGPGLSADDHELIFRAIMEQSKDGLFVTDHEGYVVMVNRACEEMNDFKAADVLGRNVADLVREGFFHTRSLSRKGVI